MTLRPIFVKLGGSLITYKGRARTVRRQALARLAGELAAFHAAHPQQPLLIGHGSGSFGHWAARQHGWHTHTGPQVDPNALQAIAQAAAALHHQVLTALRHAGLPVWSFPPSASVLTHQGRVQAWPLDTLRHSLRHGWVPVVYGDTVLDTARGGAILSTEDLFAYLAPRLQPARILLAGREPGVWQDFPRRTRVWRHLTPARWEEAAAGLRGSAAPDVTGGMAGKVQRMLTLVQQVPDLEVWVFSGLEPDALRRALEGQAVGTRLTASPSGGPA